MALQHGGGGYTAGARLGQKACSHKVYVGKICMSRSLVTLILIILVVVGGLFWLSGRDAETAQTRVEKAVPLENLSR
jgi:hypothetical protein